MSNITINLADSDEDIDDKAMRRAAEQQLVINLDDDDDLQILPTLPDVGAPAPQTAERVAPKRDLVGAVAQERRVEYTLDDSESSIVSVKQEEPIHVVAPASDHEQTTGAFAGEVSDNRNMLNEAYVVRRTALYADRITLASGVDLPTPTERSMVTRPVRPIPDVATEPLYETVASADTYSALEFGSVFMFDVNTTQVQGDEYGYSDTIGFSIGRQIAPAGDDEGVPQKRLVNVDADDSDPQTAESANYQHSFFLSTGRQDVSLPVTAMSELLTTATVADANLATVSALAETESELKVVDALRAVGSGVAPLFAAYSKATTATADEYHRVRNRAQLGVLADQLTTSLEAARAADQSSGIAVDVAVKSKPMALLSETATKRERQANRLPALESLASIEEALAERAPEADLPNIVRTRATPFTIVDGVLEYALDDIASSLLATTSGVKAETVGWDQVERLLERREIKGLDLAGVRFPWREALDEATQTLGFYKARDLDSDEEDLPADEPRRKDRAKEIRQRVEERVRVKEERVRPDSPVRRPRKLRRRGEADETIESEVRLQQRTAIEKKRKAEEGDQAFVGGAREGSSLLEFEDRPVREPRGVETTVDPFDVSAMENDLKQQGFTSGGLKSERTADPNEIGYLDTRYFPFPMLALPIGWSGVAALRRLADLVRADPSGAWQSAEGWRLIIELAVYAKLVPRLRDDELFPHEARLKLVYALELLSARVSNEVVYHSSALEFFRKNKPIVRKRLEQTRTELTAELNATPDAMDEDAAAREAELRQQLAETNTLLAIEGKDELVPPATIPAILSLHVATADQMEYVQALKGAQLNVLFTETQRVALAIAYAITGRRLKEPRTILQTKKLVPTGDQVPDEYVYPISAYTELGTLDQLYAEDTDVDGFGAATRFATAVGRIEDAQRQEEQLNSGGAGVFIEALYASLVRAQPERTTEFQRALAAAVYPDLKELETVNLVKQIFVVPPSTGSIGSFRTAIDLFQYLHTDVGVFSLKDIVDYHEAQTDNVRVGARETMETRGAERLVATAAQRYVNEFFSAGRYRLDQTELVPTDFTFDEDAVKPVGVFTIAETEFIVDEAQTLEYIRSDGLLGGGRVVVSSVALEPASERNAQLAAQIERLRSSIGESSRRVAELGDADDDEATSLRQQITSEQKTLAELEARVEPDATETLTSLEPFLYFVSPMTLAAVCQQVSSGPAIESCREYLGWFAIGQARVRDAHATASNYNEFRAVLNEFTAQVASLQRVVFSVDASLSISLLEFVTAAAQALERGQLLVLREETTRDDAVVSQTFSCLAALERAVTESRQATRDSLMYLWYKTARQLRWKRLGYIQTPFNSSQAIAMPRANVPDATYDNWQMTHLALRHALRRRRARRADAGEDEGDSGNEDEDDDNRKPQSQIDEERANGILQLQTLLNTIEKEIPLSLAAQVAWYDLFAVGGAQRPLEFARNVRRAVMDLYRAIIGGRSIVGTSLLASRGQRMKDGVLYTGTEPPLAIDPRAQALVKKYWVDYGSAAATLRQSTALGSALAEQYGDSDDVEDDRDTVIAVIDNAFFSTVASAFVSSVQKAASTNTTVATIRASLAERINRNAALAVKERAGNSTTRGNQRELPRLVQSLQNLQKAEQTAVDQIAKITDAIEQKRAKEDVKKKQTEIEALERTIRASYESNAKRVARITELLADIKDIYKSGRGPKSAAQTIETERRELEQVELRAAIYADERPSYAARLTEEAAAIQKSLDARQAQRERQALVNELRQELTTIDAQIGAIENAIAGAANELREASDLPTREQEVARAAVLTEQAGAQNERTRLLVQSAQIVALQEALSESRLTELSGTYLVASTNRAIAALDGQIATTRQTLASIEADLDNIDDVQESKRKAVNATLVARRSATNVALASLVEQRARAVVVQTALAGPLLASVAAELKQAASELGDRYTENVARRITRARPDEEKVDRELQRDIDDLGRIKLRLEPVVEVRENRRIETLLAKEQAAAEQQQTSDISDVREKTVDEAFKLARGTLASKTDNRRDLPSSRPTIYDANSDEVIYGGFYDAPLANHKQVTINGVAAALWLVHSAKTPKETQATLGRLVRPEQFDAYVEDSLRSIAELTNDEADEEAARLPGEKFSLSADTTFRDALKSHIARVVDEAVADRVRLLLRAAASLKNKIGSEVDESVAIAKATAAANATFARSMSKLSFANTRLRRIDVAALQVIRASYERYVKARRTTRMLDSLGSLTLTEGVTDLGADTLVVPRLVFSLLLPAAIERVKLEGQIAVESVDVHNWAVANRQDAPQAWRIAEIVEYYARSGRLPIPTASSTDATSPYVQYEEIRKFNAILQPLNKRLVASKRKVAQLQKKRAAKESEKKEDEDESDDIDEQIAEAEQDVADDKAAIASAVQNKFPSLAATGRLRFFPDRVSAMLGFGVVPQRLSFGNGVHHAQPFSVDLIAGAMVAQLMRLYASRQTAYDEAGLLVSMRDLWHATQTDADGARLTMDIAALPSVRDRLWCHLAMLYGKRGTPTDALFALPNQSLTLPVWRHMRPVDIRLLALVVLGFDYAPRIDEDDEVAERTPPSYAYTRINGAKLMLAKAMYDEYVDSRFAPLPTNRALLKGVAPEKVVVYYSVPQTIATGQRRLLLQFGAIGAARPVAGSADRLLAQCTNEELRALVQQRIIDRWTNAAAFDLDTTSVGDYDQIGLKIASLASGRGRAALIEAVVAAVCGDAKIFDLAWLHIPKCVILGAMMHSAQTGDIVETFPGRTEKRLSMKRRVMEVVERILLLVDDSAHLLTDDTAVSGAQFARLDRAVLATEVEVIDDEPAATTTPTKPESVKTELAPPPLPNTNVPEWRPRVETAIKSLFSLPFVGRLVGTRREAPYDAVEWPFAPIPTSTSQLAYVQQTVFVNNNAASMWRQIESVAQSVSAFVAQQNFLSLAPTSIAAAFRARFGALSERELLLGSHLARAEQERQRFWSYNADGTFVRTSNTDASLASFEPPTNEPYTNWHVLLLSALAMDMPPSACLDALKAYVAAAPPSPAIVYANTLLAKEKPLITPLHLEQIVPVAWLIVYLFDNVVTKKGVTTHSLYETVERHPLWTMLVATLTRKAIVRVEATQQLERRTKSYVTYVDLVRRRSYLPATAYTAEDAQLEAQQLQLGGDGSAVLFEHVFAKLDNEERSQKTKVYSSQALTIISRFVAPMDAPRYSIDDALQAAHQRVKRASLIGKIPTPAKPEDK